MTTTEEPRLPATELELSRGDAVASSRSAGRQRTAALLAGRGALIGWVAFMALALVPVRSDEVTLYHAGLVVVFVIAAFGLHVLVNWAGELSLAHAGMVGVPALSVIALSEEQGISPVYLLPVGVALGALTGLVVALPALRAKGVRVALVTFTAGIAINQFFLQQEWLISTRGSRSASAVSVFGIDLATAQDVYLALLAVLVLALLLLWALMHSRLGRGWLWLAANPPAAACVGIPVATYKLAAYAVAGAFAGLSGGLMVCWIGQLSPLAFPTTLNFTYLLAAVLAGGGYAGGAIAAGLVLTGAPVFFRSTSVTINTVLSYLGPIAMLMNLVSYKAGFNGAGRDLQRVVSSLTRRVAHGAGTGPSPPASEREMAPVTAAAPTLAVPAPAPVLDDGPANADRSPATMLDVQGISLAFGGLRVLADVSLDVERGAIVGLIGPNGAGKTTLFNVVSGLQRADAGRITFDGRDVTRQSTVRRSRLGIGRTFQNLGLITGETVRTNLLAAHHLSAAYRSIDPFVRPARWWREERRIARRVEGLAARLGADKVLDERVSDLSFGTARFVELACVLAGDPRLLLLDEPTTGLDAAEIDRLLAILRTQRAAGATVLVVGHDVRFIMGICDVVHVLSAGRVIASGAPDEVQSNPDVITAYLGARR